MPDIKFYLTKEGLANVKKELAELMAIWAAKTQDEAPAALQSEELATEFVAYKEDKELLEARLIELEHIIKNAEIIRKPKKESQYLVGLGAHVRLANNGKEDDFLIVGTVEANPNLKKISNESPAGQALIGKKAGENVSFGPDDKTIYKIVQVKY